ncbi:MAG: hypothetical protein WC551_11200 [Patescibacteria group bacterium]
MPHKTEHSDPVWIVAETSHTGVAGIFLAGQTYQVHPQTLAAIDSEIDARRKSLPKAQRSQVANFRYTKTVAPWDAYKDQTALRLAELNDRLNTEQAELDRLRDDQKDLLNQRAAADHDVAEFKKAGKADLNKPGLLNRLYRKSVARREIILIDLEQTADDIKEVAAAVKSLEKMIADLRGKDVEESHETETAETGPGQTKTDEDAQG